MNHKEIINIAEFRNKNRNAALINAMAEIQRLHKILAENGIRVSYQTDPEGYIVPHGQPSIPGGHIHYNMID